jgi:hypothetical protein
MKPKFTKFTHKTPHLGKKQHQLDPDLDLKHLVHHATFQYVDWDNDGDVDEYDKKPKLVPDENPTANFARDSKKLIAKERGEIKHTKRGMAYEDLRKWFGKGDEGGVGGDGWDEYNTKGERTGKCARGEDDDGEGPKPKCLSKEKAAKMSKDQIAAAVRRKRKEDPVADRPGKGGKPKMVSNKIEEQMGSVRYCPKCQKNETRSECAYGPRYWDMFSMPPAIMTDRMKYDIAQLHPTNEEKDHEHSMARSELSTVMNAAKRLKKKMGKREGNIEAWVQSKITKAADYLDAAADYLDSGEHDVQGSMDEAKKSPCWKGYRKKPGTADYEKGSCVPESVSNEPKIMPKKGLGGGKLAYEKGKEPRPTGAKLIKTVDNKVNINAGYKPSLVDKILLEMEAEVLNEKNVPTNPSLWSKMKAKAKAKFDVYPSAYANGWAAKEYKKAGGGWKSVDENVTIEDVNGKTFAEVIDIINPDPLVVQKSENEIEEAVRIPAKTGNLIHVVLTWKGKMYSLKMFFPQISTPSRRDVQDQIEKVYPGARVHSFHVSEYKPGESFLQVEDWQKKNSKDRTHGMSQDAVDAYRIENPGSKLQTAVTEKNPTGKRKERQKSYCRRSEGQMNMHNIDCSKDSDKPICKARRRWNCK